MLSIGTEVGAQCAPTTDCNGNGVLDSCDLTAGTSDDCNGNGVPDECEIALGTVEDCDLNGIPDGCEPFPEVILAPGPGASARGSALATDGTRVVVGDPGADSPVTDLGAARVYRRVGTTWLEEGLLLPSDAFTSSLEFGTSVAIEGDLIVIGAPGDGSFFGPRRGAIYIFRRIGGVWLQEQKIPSPSTTNFAEFGRSVAIDGGIVLAGAWRNAVSFIASGSVLTYSFDGTTWLAEGELAPSVRVTDARFGASLATSDGRVAIGAPRDTAGGTSGAGAVYLYERTGGSYTFLEKILSPTPEFDGDFGAALSLSGTRLLAGAPGEAALRGSAHVFGGVAGGAILETTLIGLDSIAGDAFGSAVTFTRGAAFIGAPFAGGIGRSYLFTEAPGLWNQIDAHTPTSAQSGDMFGSAVAASEEFGLVGASGGSFVTVRDILPPLDCDGDSIEDVCAITDGLVVDCDLDLIPDSCEIADGTEPDCDLDGVLDSCQLASGTATDCNGNGTLDHCDIAQLTSADCDGNGVPDECDVDCNENGIPDTCDLIAGTSLDCDGNQIPDSCDLAAGTYLDCDGNQVPDLCDIASGTLDDCNGNGIPDTCELVAGTESDCDANGVLDSCDLAAGEADCDGNGILDVCDIAGGGTPDPDPPTFGGVPGDLAVDQDPGGCTAIVTWTEPVASDTCELDQVTQSHLPGSAFAVGVTTVTYTATDVAGNSAQVSFTVTVSDVEAPTLAGLPADQILTATAGACGAVATWTAPTVDDNCPGAGFSTDAASGGFFPVGITTVTVTATDASGNSLIETFSITVTDDVAPTIADVPADFSIPAALGTCLAAATWAEPTASDDCVITSFGGDILNGSSLPVGDTLVTYSATDASGNTAMASFTVTVFDAEPPTIGGLPAPIVAATDLGTCGALVTWPAPTATDLCSGATVVTSQASGSFFPVGLTEVSVTATDGAGNSAMDTFTVTVLDQEAPTIVGMPDDLVLDTDLGTCAAIADWLAPTITDPCGAPTIMVDGTSGDAFPLGTTTVTYTATDAAGNATNASFTITVLDTEPPGFLTLPVDQSIANDPGTCGAVVTFDLPLASDACSAATVSGDHASGAFFPLGTTTVTFTATDAAGNSATTSFDVTVADLEPPTIGGLPAPIVAGTDLGTCGALVTWPAPTATDLCSGATVVTSQASGSFFPVGLTEVSVTATDAAGNSAMATFNVTVLDQEAPTIVGMPDDLVLDTDLGTCAAIADWLAPTITDPCGAPTVTVDGTSGDAFPLGTTTVTYTATDAAGNSTDASFTITVLDTEPPGFLTLPVDQSIANDPGACGAVVTFDLPLVSDACSAATVSGDHASGAFFPLGTTTVTFTATDAAGNSTTTSFDVTVADTEPPSIVGLPLGANVPADPGECGAVVTWGDPTAADACPGATIALSHASGSFFPVGTTTVSVTATDAGGLVTSDSFEVTVNDTVAPTLLGVDDVLLFPILGECTANVMVPIPTATDSCGVVSLSNDVTGTADASGIYPAGVTVVTWTALDAAGNSTTAVQSITVEVAQDDCNANGVPDSCDIGSGTSSDCNGNGIPDECDIAGGGSADVDGNGTPDECEDLFVRGDTNSDGSLDLSDAVTVLLYLFGGQGANCLDAFDANDDDLVDLSDAIRLLGIVFEGVAPPPAPFPDCGSDPGTSIGCDSGTCP